MLDQSHTVFPLLFDPGRLPEAVLAILLVTVLGVLVGPVGGDTNPLFWRIINGLFGSFGSKMDKGDRKRGDLILRGFLLTIFALIASSVIAYIYMGLAFGLSLQMYVNALFLCIFLCSGSVWRALARLYKVMKEGKIGEGAYFAIASSTRTDLSQVDDFTITRTGIAMGIRLFDKGLVAPVFWYYVAGFPAVALHAALAALSWRFGRFGEGSGFALVPLALEKLMGIIPSILSGILLSLACVFTPTAMMSKALRGWNAHKNTASYVFGGVPVNVLAWGLNISLGGPLTDLEGHKIKGRWVGPQGATAQLDAKHLHRGLYAVIVGAILLIAALIGLMIVSGHQLLDF